MNSPLVSVVMSVYNSEKYLSDSIESILNQSFSNFEFLIFDDGSTDESKNIIAEYARLDPRIKASYSSINQGYVGYLNQGISEAGGKYIARMDSDDISLDNRLHTQVEYLETHLNVNALGSSTIRIDSKGKELGLSSRVENPSDLFWLSFFTNPLSHPTVMFRRDILQKIGGYNADKLPSEDYDLWTRVLLHGDIGNINEPLLKYREHESSISVRKRDMQIRNSNATLKAHWNTWMNVDLSDNEVLFLKQFHKGYDDIDTITALNIFYKIADLRKLTVNRYAQISSRTEQDFLKKSIYLIAKVRSITPVKTIRMASILFFAYPIQFMKFLIYGKL